MGFDRIDCFVPRYRSRSSLMESRENLASGPSTAGMGGETNMSYRYQYSIQYGEEGGEDGYIPYAPRPSVLPSFQPAMSVKVVRGVCSLTMSREYS